MKHDRVIGRMISVCIVLVALMVSVSASRAAYDVYLKLSGTKGQGANIHKIVHSTTGTFDFGKLPTGTYTMQLTDAAGKPVKGSHTGWIEVNSFQYGVAAAPTTGTGGTTTNSAVVGVTANSGEVPVNHISGATTGKRQHTPIMVKKEVDMASPLLFSVAAGDVDKNGTTDIQATFTFQKAP